jgi:hypothetical protein
MLPTFSTPAANLDCIDLSGLSDAESDLFTSLQGIVNRAQPRIACVAGGDGEGKTTWLDLHNLPYTTINGYTAIQKYKTNVAGLVVVDTNLMHTLNLATTISGVSNQLICTPALLSTLTNSPYSFPVIEDLRGRFADKYQVYGYLYTNYWPQCTHRMVAGLYTNLHGELRDYLVALKCATLWLDPATTADKNLLARFVSVMPPMNGIYTGWWPNEGSGLNWIAGYGIPVLASDYFRNGSVFSGVAHALSIPEVPPPPPLQNKVYVSLIISDGDNIQYMQHVMKMDWNLAARGTFPIGWTITPLASEMDPAMLSHYLSTATPNDCLISGPSGAGYTHMQNWGAANLAAFTKTSRSYLERSGLRVITIWEQVNTGIARSFATNCPSLWGLTDQSGGTYTSVNQGLRTLGLTVAYSSDTNAIYSGITNAAAGWNGTAPMFLAAQANVWDVGPNQLRGIAGLLDTNKYVVVRPDHLFLLYNSVYGYPCAVTKRPSSLTQNAATLQGFVLPNAGSAAAWAEWGTSPAYGNRSSVTNVSGTALVPVRLRATGLSQRTAYHYRVVSSNAMGLAFGADQTFTTGNRVKAWGDGGLGQTAVPGGLTNSVALGCGVSHALAVKSDGSVVAWGNNSAGQTNVPAGLANVVSVAGGMLHSVALKADGNVVAWGDNTSGQTNVPAGLTNVIEIAAGNYHNLALKADGTVVAWGGNSSGQTNVPAGLTNVVGVAAGFNHSVALKLDGSVVAWGNNTSGQTNVPAGLSHVVAVAAGQSHTLALKADGFAATNLSPAVRWVADSLPGADGSQVTNWYDSIASRPASQATSTYRPRLYSNAMNGHKVVRFIGSSSQYLTVQATNSPMSAAGSFVLAVVLKTSTAGNSSSLFYLNTGILGCEQANVVADWALCLNNTQLGAGLGAGAGGCGSDLSLYGGTVADGLPHIALYARNGDTISLYLDGVIVATQSGLCPGARGNYAFQIGAMTSTSYYFTGDIAEIQVFDRGLSSREISSVNEMLAASYGIGGLARTVVAWGYNGSGQTNGPASLTNLAAVASGSLFNLALRGNSTVAGWGNNASGQTNLVSGLTNVAAIACGSAFGLALGNQTPWITNLIVSGYASHDLALALPGGDPDGYPLTFSLVSMPGTGALYQSAGGNRGSLISAAGTVVTDAGEQLVFAPVAGETGSPYATFSFTASNAFYSAGAAQVRVNIGLPGAPQLSGPAVVALDSGVQRLAFAGNSNATYSLWASTNLLDWTRLGMASETAPGQYEYLDSAAAGQPQRFYRATAP